MGVLPYTHTNTTIHFPPTIITEKTGVEITLPLSKGEHKVLGIGVVQGVQEGNFGLHLPVLLHQLV